MKKIALVLLICIYSLSSFGIGIKQFYCCGKLKSTSIVFVQPGSNEKCSKGDATDGCCQTKYKSLKIKDSHVAADAVITSGKYFSDIYLYTPSFEVTGLANEPMTVANMSHAPPLHPGTPIYILLCVYRI